MQEFELISEYPVTARRLFDLLKTPAFQEAVALRFGAEEVTAQELAQSGKVIEMKIERLDPGWSLLGGLVNGKPMRSVMHFAWRLDSLVGKWNRTYMDHDRNITVEGLIRVEPMGDQACRLTESGTVRIKVALIGRGIERKLVSHLQEIQPRRVDFTMKMLGLQV